MTEDTWCPCVRGGLAGPHSTYKYNYKYKYKYKYKYGLGRSAGLGHLPQAVSMPGVTVWRQRERGR